MCLSLVVFLITWEDIFIEFYMSSDEGLVGYKIQQLVTSLVNRIS